ncbi:MAG: ROK family transcriptional regulator [Salinivirgaceae bacterium]|jgi:glucokinase-like ROK family protein|nr:ROK family transcriptional regulator [Salinivirgaceae bacterium]
MADISFQHDKLDFQGNLNKIKVLQLIRNKKEITRAEIIKISRLSAPTVTRIVESLVQLKLIQTDGIGSSIGGRRPQLIKFTSKDNYVIGIDIGATYIRSALSNLDGEFIYEIQVPTNISQGFTGVMEQVGELIEKLSDRAQQNSLTLWGIGIAICGMVNKNTGIVEFSPIFNWTNVNVRKALSKYTNLNIAIGNVVQLFALGELLYGVGKKYSDFICVNLGYGIGSGIVADGKLFGGADGIAGEIGHIVVDNKSSKQGIEGLTGTLETLASGYGIAEIAQELAPIRKDSILNNMQLNAIDAKKVFEAANENDKLANEILEEVANYLCIGIDTLIKLFNTECIVLSGGLIENGDILFEKIRTNISKYSMKAISRSVPIVQSSFGENAALMGAFSLILEKILQLDQNSF